MHLLPAPIAYVRHLVDVEDDFRAKFDQLRVLAQNTVQVMAAILLSDCERLGLTAGLATQPMAKKFAVGDFVTHVVEAADQLVTKIDASYVPELVQLYGENNREVRKRRERLQQMVQSRNRDAHTASLGQTKAWLDMLLPEVDAVLKELVCLRPYVMVAAKNVEPAPDRVSSTLNGLRCQGFSERYIPIKQTISPLVSRSEVILIKIDRSDWLSLRPWFLYFLENDRDLGNASDEIGLLNAVDSRYLNYIGLVSGKEYRVGGEWRSFTMYSAESSIKEPGHEDASDDDPVMDLLQDSTRVLIDGLAESNENLIVEEQSRASGKEYLVSIRTPGREVAVAMIDEHGEVQLFRNMLERAVGEGLLDGAKLEAGFKDLEDIGSLPPRGAALIDVGNLTDRVDWLDTLARSFAN